ncbi:MAG: DUF72 domain-containing protein [Myxococcota bacterium]
MHVRVGTSGFSYDEWNGVFYPKGTKPADRLRYYAERLPTVEINNTFYRMPRGSMLDGWRDKVPESFRFVLKASRRITHQAKIAPEAEDSVRYLWEVSSRLGTLLGPFLFQLPPYLRKDVERLRGFLASLPAGMRAALEFRHRSWLDDEVYAVLREHGAAMVAADFEDDEAGTPLVATAGFGYLRLRADDYDDSALADWAGRILEQPWQEAYVFFKHEDEGAAPRLAARLLATLAATDPGAPTTRSGSSAP